MEIHNLTGRKGSDSRFDTDGRTLRFATAQHGERLDMKGDVERIPTRVNHVIVLNPGVNNVTEAEFESLYRDGDGALFVSMVRLGKIRVPDHEELEAVFGVDAHIDQRRLEHIDASSVKSEAELKDDDRVHALEAQVAELTKIAAGADTPDGQSAEIEALKAQVAELTAVMAAQADASAPRRGRPPKEAS